jgi:hypothetical protein
MQASFTTLSYLPGPSSLAPFGEVSIRARQFVASQSGQIASLLAQKAKRRGLQGLGVAFEASSLFKAKRTSLSWRLTAICPPMRIFMAVLYSSILTPA